MKGKHKYLLLILYILLIALMLMYLSTRAFAQETGYSPIMTFEATAYCHTGNLTKTGTVPLAGRTVAVDPEVIPLGSTVIVYIDRELHGIYQAEDTGSLIKGQIIDIFMVGREECREFGRRAVEVQVVQAVG